MLDVGHRPAVHGVGRLVGEEPEVLGAADRGRAHEPDRLAGVDALDRRDLGRPALDQVGDCPEDLLTLRAGTAGPVTERVPRRPTRRIDVGDVAGSHLTQQGTVDR